MKAVFKLLYEYFIITNLFKQKIRLVSQIGFVLIFAVDFLLLYSLKIGESNVPS